MKSERCFSWRTACLAALLLALSPWDTPKASEATDRGAAGVKAEAWSAWVTDWRRERAHFRAFPHFDRAFRRLSEQRLADAAQSFAAGLAHEPDNELARRAGLDTLLKLGREREALVHYDVLLATMPDAHDLRAGRAGLLLRLNDDARAREDLRQLHRHADAGTPLRDWAARQLAELELRQGRVAPAEAALQDLLARDPQSTDLALSAHAHALAGRWSSALTAVGRAIEREPDARRQLGLSMQRAHYARQHGDPVVVHAVLRDLVSRQSPPDTGLMRELIVLALAQHRLEDAVAWRTRQLEQPSDAPAELAWWPQLLMQHGHFVLADQAYVDALKQSPSLAQRHALWMGLGYAAEKQGRLHRAWRAFRQAAAIQPTAQALAAERTAQQRALVARAHARSLAAARNSVKSALASASKPVAEPEVLAVPAATSVAAVPEVTVLKDR